MPAWGNTDAANAKPKFDVERQTREVVQLTTANLTLSGQTSITFTYTDSGLSNVANVGVTGGMYVYVAGQGSASSNVSANGYPGIFASNNTVAGISANTVVLSAAVTANVPAGTVIEFDKAIVYNANKTVEVTYNQDTVLLTATRNANATFNSGNMQPGWIHIQKKTNNDGTVRYLKETLVALANPVASNTNSGNTSWGQAFTGL